MASDKRVRWHLTVPIRVKIVILVGGMLSVSLLSNLYVGSTLIVHDKISYIYDYNLAQLRSVSDAVEAQLAKATAEAKLLAGLSSKESPASVEKIARLFAQDGKAQGIEGLVVLQPDAADHFGIVAKFGNAENALERLGWTPAMYRDSPLLVGTVTDGLLPIGSSTLDADEKSVAFVALLRITPDFSEIAKDVQLHLVDNSGQTLSSTVGFEKHFNPPELEAFERSLQQANFNSGVRDQPFAGESYIVGYRRIAANRLMVVSLIPKDVAFTAAAVLRQRSLALGISILLLSGGLTLAFVKGMTARLRQMWLATQRVAEGDFSVRVNTSTGRTQDEITSLGASFNAMADKIDDLMIQTAEKARMEKELETAQAIQSMFFPPTDFASSEMMISGKSISASECAGDWWHYAKVGDHLIVAVGDVTGHGVSAALVTAAAHGAFSVITKQIRENLATPPSLAALIDHLNASVFSAANGNSTMTFFASMIDLNSGMMTYCNASHCPTYIYRRAPGDEARPPSKRVKALVDAKCPALGQDEKIEVETSQTQLYPNDLIFWYTDGLLDIRVSDQAKMSKLGLFELLAKLAAAPGSDAKRVCDGVIAEAMEFFGESDKNRVDDITVVVGVFSKTSGPALS